MGSILVRVADYQVLADVGINADEANRTQPLIVSTEVQLDRSDVSQITETVDYRKIVAEIEQLSQCHIPLIETFAGKLARNCLQLPFARHVKVEIDKPFALTRGLAGVVVEMSKDDI